MDAPVELLLLHSGLGFLVELAGECSRELVASGGARHVVRVELVKGLGLLHRRGGRFT